MRRALERYRIGVARSPAGINDHSDDVLPGGEKPANDGAAMAHAEAEQDDIKGFVKRMARNALHEDQRVWKRGALLGGLEVARRAVIDVVQRRFDPKVGLAVSEINLAPEAAVVAEAKGDDFRVALALEDLVFEYHLTRRLLAAAGVDVDKTVLDLPGSHTLFNADACIPQLVVITDYAKERRAVHNAPTDNTDNNADLAA